MKALFSNLPFPLTYFDFIRFIVGLALGKEHPSPGSYTPAANIKHVLSLYLQKTFSQFPAHAFIPGGNLLYLRFSECEPYTGSYQ